MSWRKSNPIRLVQELIVEIWPSFQWGGFVRRNIGQCGTKWIGCRAWIDYVRTLGQILMMVMTAYLVFSQIKTEKVVIWASLRSLNEIRYLSTSQQILSPMYALCRLIPLPQSTCVPIGYPFTFMFNYSGPRSSARTFTCEWDPRVTTGLASATFKCNLQVPPLQENCQVISLTHSVMARPTVWIEMFSFVTPHSIYLSLAPSLAMEAPNSVNDPIPTPTYLLQSGWQLH